MDSENSKWIFLRDAPARDAQTPEMLALANPLRQVATVSPWPVWAFAQLALCVARDLIVYMSDITRVGREQIDGFTDPQGSTLESLQRGTDDCDAKARIFVALCLTQNIPARMVPRWRTTIEGRALRHVSAQVYLQGPLEKAARWWSVETILDRARLGDTAESIPVEIDTGRWAQTESTAAHRAA